MRILALLTVLMISGCAGMTQEGAFHQHYRYLNDRMIGLKSDPQKVCRENPELELCKKVIIDDEYYERSFSTVSPYSKTKGVCRTIYKIRSSDNIIVDWRFEGRREDCLDSPK